MTEPLIRTQQRWLLRAIDMILTLLAWAGFFYLFFTGFIAVLQKRPPVGEHLHFLFLWATIDTLAVYLLIGAVNAAVLALWAQYNFILRRVERRSAIAALDDEELIMSFNLSPDILQAMRSGPVITVHNDDHGRISSVEAGSVLQPPLSESGRGSALQTA